MRKKYSVSISLPKIITALIFIYIGGWFLLNSLGLMNANLKETLLIFIPYFLVVWGLGLLLSPFISRKHDFGSHWLFGLFFLSYGSAVLGGSYELFDFTWGDVWKLWPMLIVYTGFMILFDGSKKRSKKNYHHHAKKTKHYKKSYGGKKESEDKFDEDFTHDIEKEISNELNKAEEVLREKNLDLELKQELQNNLSKDIKLKIQDELREAEHILREKDQKLRDLQKEIRQDRDERQAEREKRQEQRERKLARFYTKKNEEEMDKSKSPNQETEQKADDKLENDPD